MGRHGYWRSYPGLDEGLHSRCCSTVGGGGWYSDPELLRKHKTPRVLVLSMWRMVFRNHTLF